MFSLTFFFFSSRRRHTRSLRDWSSDVCSSDLPELVRLVREGYRARILIAYGAYWFPWFMRRLAERPANVRSEERRVGKECRSRGAKKQEKKKKCEKAKAKTRGKTQRTVNVTEK